MNPEPKPRPTIAGLPGNCKHELDKTIPLVFDPQYGRIGVCKLCRRPVVYVKINYKPKRERFKGSKKERLNSRKAQENLDGEIRRNY